MLFNVAGLLNSEVGATRTEHLENETIATEGSIFEEIVGTVHMLRTDSTILVSVDADARTTQTCSRCLEPAEIALSLTIEEEFYPTNHDLGGGPISGRGEPEDEALVIDDKNMLDLHEVLRQALTAALPIAPICAPDCAGICPVCLRDRNVEPCDCHQDSPETPFAPLAKLLARDAN